MNMSESDYNFEGGKFFYMKNGKQVAHLEGGEVVFEPGMVPPHKTALLAWWETQDSKKDSANAPGNEGGKDSANAPGNEGGKEKKDVPAPVDVNEIPDDMLPPFSKMLGVETPGFAEYVKKHKFDAAQKEKLVRRLEHKN